MIFDTTKRYPSGGGEEVFYTTGGALYVKNIVSPSSNQTIGYEYCSELESISAPNSTSAPQYGGGRDCVKLKSVWYPKASTFGNYFIRQQSVSTHTLDTIEIGSIGYPVTSLTYRWFYGDCASNVTITAYVAAATIADVPTAVSQYIIGDNHPARTQYTVIYRSSTTGEILT